MRKVGGKDLERGEVLKRKEEWMSLVIGPAMPEEFHGLDAYSMAQSARLMLQVNKTQILSTNVSQVLTMHQEMF